MASLGYQRVFQARYSPAATGGCSIKFVWHKKKKHLASCWVWFCFTVLPLEFWTSESLKFLSLPDAGTLGRHECSWTCLQNSQWKQRLGWVPTQWCLQRTAGLAWQFFLMQLILSRNILSAYREIWNKQVGALISHVCDATQPLPFFGSAASSRKIIIQNCGSQISESFLQAKPNALHKSDRFVLDHVGVFLHEVERLPLKWNYVSFFLGNQVKTLHTSDCDSCTKITRMHSSGLAIPP